MVKMKLTVCLSVPVLVVFTCLFNGCHGWTNEDFEIFDLVEEVPKNFYEFMGISQVTLQFFSSTMFSNFAL